MNAARIWIARSHRGERWHIVPKPGTAFPVGACGSNVERNTYLTVPSDKLSSHFRNGRFRGSQLCQRCQKIEGREQA